MDINYQKKKIAFLLVLILLNLIILTCKAEKKQKKPVDTVKQEKTGILVNDLITIKPEETSILIDDPFAAIVDNITNETCAQIYKLWDILRKNNFYKERDIVQEKLENLLIGFLRTEESWSIDVKKEMPFLDCFSVSEDNMVRIYSWYYDQGTGDTSLSIIQYKAEPGIINAIQVSGYGYERFDQYRQLGFDQGPSYKVGFKIEKYTYLIFAISRGVVMR